MRLDRELIQIIELYLELPARRLYGEAFFGGRVSEETKKEVSAALAKAVRALGKLARFQPFIAGPEFSYADCAAYAHLPVVSSASRAVLGADALASVAGIADYMKFISDQLGVEIGIISTGPDRDATIIVPGSKLALWL